MEPRTNRSSYRLFSGILVVALCAATLGTWSPRGVLAQAPGATDTATPAGPPALLQPPVLYPAGSSYALAAGDFNADGAQDLAVATNAGQLQVFLQNSDHQLSISPVSYPLDFGPFALAAGDLNHDGRTDLALSGISPSNPLGVFLQAPDGTLQTMQTYSPGLSPVALAVGDLNDDGLADVAVFNIDGHDISVFSQNVGGGLYTAGRYATPALGYSLGIGDINGDGRSDLIQSNDQAGGPNLLVYLQNSDGTLAAAAPYSLDCGGCTTTSLAIGDVTNDTRADLLVGYQDPTTNAAGIAVVAQAADGTLLPAQFHPADAPIRALRLADIDRDGLPDLVTENGSPATEIGVYLERPDTGLADPLYFPLSAGNSQPALPDSLDVADFNQDGWPDVAVSQSTGLAILYGGGQVVVPPPTLTPTETPTGTATGTLTPTRTPTLFVTPPLPLVSPTGTATITVTVTVTPTSTATTTNTRTLTPSPSATLTLTPTDTLTSTGTATATATPSLTATQTPSLTVTITKTRTPTRTPTLTNTNTVTATETATPTPTATFTPTSTDTETFTPTPSDTPSPSATWTLTPTVTLTPTRTRTPTRTLTPTRTHRPSETPVRTRRPTITLTPSRTLTPTRTRRPTITPTPTQTGTPTITPTPTITSTPTPLPTVIVDDFNGPLLGPDWQWYLPSEGPTYSLGANPGHIQVSVAPGHIHTGGDDSAPELRRTDMGTGDWAIESYLAAGAGTAGDGSQAALMVGYGQYDQLWLAVNAGGGVHILRPGVDDTYVDTAALPLYLRIEKTGAVYTFKERVSNTDPWTTLGTYNLDQPVAYVGLLEQNPDWNSGSGVLDADYFRLERFGPAAPAPYTETEFDTFDTANLSPGWEWYTPVSGPTYALNAVPGSLRLSLPASQSFEHWLDTDNAPQLRRTDLGDRDWAIETGLDAIDAPSDAGYLTGLELGFGQFDQVWLGMGQDGLLNAQRIGVDQPMTVHASVPILLRVEKHGEIYTFMYRHDPNEAWTLMQPKDYPGTPVYVGLIARVFQGGSAPINLDWSYFRLDRQPSAPSTPTFTPTVTPTQTATATNTITRTVTLTVTPTITRTASAAKTSTPTQTPVTPSNTPTQTVTRTRTPTATPVSPTPTSTQTATATSASTLTATPSQTATPTATIVPLFQPYQTYPAAAGIAVGTGDFNGDGRLDAAMTTTGHLLVFPGSSAGLLAPVSYPASANPIALGAADLNGDGRKDIVLADLVSNTISLYLQQTDGSLAARLTYPTGLQPDALAVGDVNGDGRADVVVSHWNTGSLGVFIQNASGTLNPMVSYPAPLAGYDDLAIGDVNGDGLQDVVKMNGTGGAPRLWVYLQNPDGTLASPVPYTTHCDACVPGGLAIGDLTGDGLADIAVTYGGSAPESRLDVLAQAPGGFLLPAVSYAAHDVPEPVKLADLNQDGRLDLVTAHGFWGGGFSVYLQPLGDYSLFNLPELASYYEPGALAIGDLDGDGLPDVIVAGSDGLLVSYHAEGLGPTGTPGPTAAPDFTPTQTGTPTPTWTPISSGG